MRGKLLFLVIVASFIAIACAEKKTEPTTDISPLLSTDSVVKLTAADTSSDSYRLFLPSTRDDSETPDVPTTIEPTSIDTAAARTMPDFTDNGVGMLIQNTARESPSMITTCLIPQFQAFFVSTNPFQPCSGPYFGQFIAPDPMMPIMPQCSTGTFVTWNTTGNQLVRWSTTSSTVRNMFTTHLSAYQAAVGGGYFPLYVYGLNYGGSSCAPYSVASLQRVLNPDGSNNYWNIRLLP